MPAWIIFRDVGALMVVQTKFWNTNAPGNTEICTLKKLSLPLKLVALWAKIGFALKPSSQYYFQLQLQMFVSELSLNILVVWTKQVVFTVEVPFNASFMTKVCSKLEMFWSQQILPFMMNNLVSTATFPGM